MTDRFEDILSAAAAAAPGEVDGLVATLALSEHRVLRPVLRRLKQLGQAGDPRLLPVASALCTRATGTGVAPELASALTAAARSLAELKQWAQSARLLDDVLAMVPDEPRALRRQAMALVELGRRPEAVERMARLLALDPGNVAAARLIAVNASASQIAAVAGRIAPLAVERAGKDPAARGDCLRVLVRLMRFDEARALIEECPSFAEPAIAAAAFDIGINSNDPEMAARALQERRWEAGSEPEKDSWIVRLALLRNDRATLRPAYGRLAAADRLELLDSPVRRNASLSLGNYRDAFLPWTRRRRLRVGELVPQLFRPGEPLDSLRGKKALIIAYTELGDEIKAIEVFDRVRPLFGSCTIVVDRRIRDLVARGRPGLTVVGKEKVAPAPPESPVPAFLRRHLGEAEWESIASFDLVFLIEDFTGLLVETEQDLPRLARVLEPDGDLRTKWREELRRRGDGPWVGLFWRSGLVSYKRRGKLTTLHDWQPILGACPAGFVNLQFGAGVSEEIAAVAPRASIVEMPGLNVKDDIDSVAALMCELDAVVTVPGTTMHLAGAVGARTLSVTHPSQALWRARADGRTGTWSPNVEVVTGPADDGFDGAIAHAAARLREMLGDRNAGGTAPTAGLVRR